MTPVYPDGDGDRSAKKKSDVVTPQPPAKKRKQIKEIDIVIQSTTKKRKSNVVIPQPIAKETMNTSN